MPDSKPTTYTTTIGDRFTIKGYAVEGVPLVTVAGISREGLIDLAPSEARRIAADLETFVRRAERMACRQARELLFSTFMAPIKAATSGQLTTRKARANHVRRTRTSDFQP